jgi:hypothetical protein
MKNQYRDPPRRGAGSKSLYIVGATLLAAHVALGADVGTAFTYQGSLEKPAGTPLTGVSCDFRFGLWDDPAAGALVTVTAPAVNPATSTAVPVTGGVFTATMDFGINAINGTGRWLAIEVKCPGDVVFIPLAPRVELTPAPHALALPGVATRQDTQQVLITAPGGVGIGTNEPKAALDVNGRVILRDRGTPPTTGTGMELGYNPATELGFIQVLDRDTLTWKDLSLGSSNVYMGSSLTWGGGTLSVDQLGSIELGLRRRGET